MHWHTKVNNRTTDGCLAQLKNILEEQFPDDRIVNWLYFRYNIRSRTGITSRVVSAAGCQGQVFARCQL
jgi:hypothetical protein